MGDASIESVLDEVATAVGLEDFGDPSFLDGLRVLAANIELARLTPLGEAAYDSMVRTSLANRLRVTDWAKSHPAVTNERPEVASIIIGLPRSGTTALSHLLGADPANRSPRAWEVSESVPPPTRSGYWTDARYQAALANPGIAALNPEFRAIHHDAPEDPIECAMILGQHFSSVSITTLFNVEPYDDWLLGADLSKAYEWHATVLQVLGSEYAGPWQLKSPVHSYAVQEVAAAYSDALIIQTHRDPARCLASNLSLVACLAGTFTDHDFRPYIARHWPEIAATMVDRVVEHRDRHGDDQFIDIPYQSVVSDPLGCVRRIYERLDRDLTPETEAVLAGHLATATQHRYGVHTYSLADFGLRREPFDERVAAYWERFDVPKESA